LPPGQVVFDSNRQWTGKLPQISVLYPDARAICCVRHVGWIIDSIERLVRATPLQQSARFAQREESAFWRRPELNRFGAVVL